MTQQKEEVAKLCGGDSDGEEEAGATKLSSEPLVLWEMYGGDLDIEEAGVEEKLMAEPQVWGLALWP